MGGMDGGFFPPVSAPNFHNYSQPNTSFLKMFFMSPKEIPKFGPSAEPYPGTLQTFKMERFATIADGF